jgi:hypothetical protein
MAHILPHGAIVLGRRNQGFALMPNVRRRVVKCGKEYLLRLLIRWSTVRFRYALRRVPFVAPRVQFERSLLIADAHDLCQVNGQKRRDRPGGLILMDVTQLV